MKQKRKAKKNSWIAWALAALLAVGIWGGTSSTEPVQESSDIQADSLLQESSDIQADSLLQETEDMPGDGTLKDTPGDSISQDPQDAREDDSSQKAEESQDGSSLQGTQEENTPQEDTMPDTAEEKENQAGNQTQESFSVDSLPAFDGSTPYVEVNGNKPYFGADELTTEPFERYSSLDAYGRCGAAYANICRQLMPTEERGEIGQIKPSGWHVVKYNDLIDGNYLYNRCHLIGYQLAGENANEKNLITGTRYLNVSGMLPFEDMVADYVERTDGHVLYRVTPVFVGEELVARGVRMEALSVEDNGKGICFHVFCYNCQPGITIDYMTGESRVTDDGGQAAESKQKTGTGKQKTGTGKQETGTGGQETETGGQETETAGQAAENGQGQPTGGNVTYILNKNTHKFHNPGCSSVADMKESNKIYFSGTRDEAIAGGYDPCKRCNP